MFLFLLGIKRADHLIEGLLGQVSDCVRQGGRLRYAIEWPFIKQMTETRHAISVVFRISQADEMVAQVARGREEFDGSQSIDNLQSSG